MNATDPALPLTPRMVEALALRDTGLPISAIADRMGVNKQRVSDLLRSAARRTGGTVTHRAPPRSPDEMLRDRLVRSEARSESLRQRVGALEREMAELRRMVVRPVTHRRLADGGVGGRRERAA